MIILLFAAGLVAVWFVLALIFALFVGGGIRLADESVKTVSEEAEDVLEAAA